MCAHTARSIFRRIFPKSSSGKRHPTTHAAVEPDPNDIAKPIVKEPTITRDDPEPPVRAAAQSATPITTPDQAVGNGPDRPSVRTHHSLVTEARPHQDTDRHTPVKYGGEADSNFLRLSTRTIVDEQGKSIQEDRLLEQTQYNGAVIPGIKRSQTIPVPVIEAQDFTYTLPPLPVNADKRHDDREIIVTPQFPTLSRKRSTGSQVYLMDMPNPIFPNKIRCCLDVTFEEMQKFDSFPGFEDFVWYDLDSYKKIKATIDKVKEVFVERKIAKPSDDIYLRFASCFVKGTRNQSRPEGEDTVLIELDEDDMETQLHDAAIRAICGFIHSHPYQSFELVVHCDYSAIDHHFVVGDGLLSWPAEKPPFHTAIQDVYDTKMRVGRRTIKKQQYLSPADQKVLVNPANVKRIIEEDEGSAPKLTSKQKADLVEELNKRPASFLQAACVYRGIPMRFLYHLLFEPPHVEQRCSDNLETLRLEDPAICTDESCNRYYERLSEHIHQFFPDVVRQDPRLARKHDRAVVPVRYGEKRVQLGGGGFGKVYEVDIDPHCQMLSPVSFEYEHVILVRAVNDQQDVKRTYALKEFTTEFTTSTRMKDAFDHEIRMLLSLAKFPPHEHILTHITSWEQEGTYYILYEKAHCNLREHMKRCKGGVLTKQRTLWFFYQLRGLADAIRRIHLFRESDTDPSTGLPTPKKTGIIGAHHDIKPENILAFDPEELPTLKLSDFGAGKFSHMQNRHDSLPSASGVRFTRTYAGPECHQAMKDMGHKVTRPFDIWALGCVFLELLLWFLGIEFPDGRLRFDEMRVDKVYNPQHEMDYFWQREPVDGSFKLNKAVVYVLNKLQDEECKGMQPFQDLLNRIRQMLVITPKGDDGRIEALQLCNALDAIFVQVQAELDQSPRCYSDIYERNKPPEVVSDELAKAVPNFLNVSRLEEDISITTESRTESATKLRDLDSAAAAAAASQLEGQGGAGPETQESGSQFPGAGSSPQTYSSSFLDDDGAVYMKDAAPRPSLSEQVEQDFKHLQGDP